MKKIILSVSLFLSVFAFAQTGNVGINTTNPKATLDVTGSPTITTKLDGVIAPRITGEQLRLKTYTTDQTGAIVYVTEAAIAPLDNQVIKVSAAGYYYFDGTIWQTMVGSSGGTSVEPWNEATTTNPATSNTQNIYQTGNVGIGNTNPQNALHVTATANPVKLEGLQTGTGNDKMVVAQTDGVLKVVNQPKTELIRIGVNGVTAGQTYLFGQLNALRFSKYNEDFELGTTPSGHNNFFQTISGSSFTENASLTSFPVPSGENTVPANRTTDIINLPAGLYEITFRVKGNVSVANVNFNTKLRILVSVNNNYYVKTYTNTGGNVEVTNDSSFILSLDAPSSIDFLLEPTSGNAAVTNLDLQDVAVMGGTDACGKSIQIMRSEIIIKKIGQDSTSRTCLAKMAPKK